MTKEPEMPEMDNSADPVSQAVLQDEGEKVERVVPPDSPIGHVAASEGRRRRSRRRRFCEAKEADDDVPAPKKVKQEETWFETIKTIFYALLIALVIRTFLFQPFNIPSESMQATLLVGDYLFVEKFAYGYSRNSFPFRGWPVGQARCTSNT